MEKQVSKKLTGTNSLVSMRTAKEEKVTYWAIRVNITVTPVKKSLPLLKGSI